MRFAAWVIRRGARVARYEPLGKDRHGRTTFRITPELGDALHEKQIDYPVHITVGFSPGNIETRAAWIFRYARDVGDISLADAALGFRQQRPLSPQAEAEEALAFALKCGALEPR
jgi:hypothetical protein